jgi:transcriptional regulator with XRE-family HTH domain
VRSTHPHDQRHTAKITRTTSKSIDFFGRGGYNGDVVERQTSKNQFEVERWTSAMPKQTPTIKDVAAYAGVSVTTVTNVLNGRGHRFSEETRQKVLRAVEALGYRPNQVARSLVRRRSYTLGVVVEHFRGALLGNPTSPRFWTVCSPRRCRRAISSKSSP